MDSSNQNETNASQDAVQARPAVREISSLPSEGGGTNRWLVLLAIVLGTVLVAALGYALIGRILPSPSGEASTEGGLGDGIRAWWIERNADALEAPSSDAKERDFEVLAGEALPAVAERLQEEGLIKDASIFAMLARQRGLDTRIQAGRHSLSDAMTADEVLDELRIAEGDSIVATLPEGWRIEEIADVLSNADLVDRTEFIELAQSPSSDVLTALSLAHPEGATLEGYIFPDTYEFDPNEADTVSVLKSLLSTMSDRFDPSMRAEAEAAGLSAHEVLTLASIVEREAVLDSERAQIARVYLNRLAEPPYILNADPTIQYALGFQSDLNTWWKRPLLYADLELDSPYNSYTQGGLPPGPIASPGLASIRAVLDPPAGTWRYFVANYIACDGSHVFADTLEQHAANVEKYQNAACGDQ